MKVKFHQRDIGLAVPRRHLPQCVVRQDEAGCRQFAVVAQDRRPSPPGQDLHVEDLLHHALESHESGQTTGLTGTVEPHIRFPGGTYTAGNARPAITDDGTFTWKRQASKKTYIYFTHGEIRSNRVIIEAR